ncbi:MAG: succinate dehydrogenase cytochrome b subunit [Nitriliruptorales bacterium]|nr:succinate dehydrogenase cytochrome b subunit [Nitriliruptorales bacterium]
MASDVSTQEPDGPTDPAPLEQVEKAGQKPTTTRSKPWLLELYGTAVGKKYVMAVTGIIGMGYVFAHMIGNLKVYLGPESINHYGEWLRESLGYPILPHTMTLWLMRIVLIAALVLHVLAAYQLTTTNWRARSTRYQSQRDYIAADFAARTMRWTGVIVLLFIGYHLADFTWGWEVVNPDFERGDVYNNMVASFSNPWVAAWYVAANLALGVHLYHGSWSLFQSLGVNSPRFNPWRRWFAVGFTLVVIVPNISFPVSVLTGIIG